METLDKQNLLAHLVGEGEKDKAVQTLLEWSLETSFKEVIINILEPLLIEWGQLWMHGQLSLAHGYLSGKVAEEFYWLASQNANYKLSLQQSKGTLILGNIEDDFHPLGRRLVGVFAKSAGWKVIDLGNDVLAETFIEKAIEHHADIIAVSAMMFTTAKNISKVRKELDNNNLNIPLAVGGAVFKLRPELVAEVGGNGTANNAIEAPELFNTLKNHD